MYEQNFFITNLDCDACIKLSTTALKAIPGVNNIEIDLKSGKTKIQSEQPLVWGDITSRLSEIGKIAKQN